MAKRIDRDNEPYRPILSVSKEKVDELFSLINTMDTQQIKQFSMINSITLNVESSQSGDNLIHKVISLNNGLKKEVHRLNMIKFLYQNGVNPDKPNRENQTPLHLACKEQYFSIVEYLISIGVDLNFKDNIGFTPFHYALMGKIELYIEPKEIKDFIEKPKKIDFEKKDKLIKVKQAIWNKIKDSSFISAISNTVDTSLYSDENIKKEVLNFTKKISENILKINKTDSIKLIREQVNMLKQSIENSVKEKWGEFRNISELDIHDISAIKGPVDSWVIPGNKLSPLKNVNVKDSIRNQSNISKQQIKKICELIEKEVNKTFDMNEESKKIYIQFYIDFLNKNPDLKIKETVTKTTIQKELDPSINISDTKWEDFNKEKMHSLAIDFADNIINWDDMTFIGGSREIEINYDINRIKKILEYISIEERVLHILGKLDDNAMSSFDKDNIANSKKNDGTDVLDITNDDDVINISLPYYLIFGKVPIDKTHGVGNDKLMEKWSKLFTTNDFASVLYTQICTKACKDEKKVRDNLTGEINTESCALTIAMKLSNGVLKNEHLDTAFKKYYISYFSDNIVNKTNTIQENLNAMINVLLAKNLTNNPDDYKVHNNDISTKIGLLFSAMNNYYSIKGVLPYNSINETNAQIEISNQKNDLIKLIMSEINKMDVKPLEFDILQIITFILNDFKDDDAKLFNLDSSTYTNLFPIIPDEDKYSDETKNNYINKLIHIIKQRQTTLLIPYIYHLLEILNCGIFCNYEKHSLYKLNESRHLGLYYKGLIPYLQSIPNITLQDNHPIAKREIKLLLNPKSWNLLNDKIDKGDIPIIGNYIDSGTIAVPKKLNINEKLNYYSYTIAKCRPPLEESIKILGLRNKNNLITILSKITSNKDSDNSLINLIDSNSRLAKVFTDIYSPIMILGELIDFEDDKTKINKLIDDIIMNVNKYNSYILLYYYLMNKDKLIKIPKFNYYEIPKIGKTGKFLYFDDDNNNLNLNRFDSSNVPDSPESDIPKNINSSVIYHKGVPLFRRLIRNLNDNFFKDKYIIKKESLVRSKNVGLPPSIASILEEFYKYNLILLLKEQFDDFLANANNSILADVKEIKDEFDITNNDVLTYFTIGKIIEELISEHSKDYIQKQSFRIVTKLLKKIDTENPSQFPNFSTSSMIVKSDDFSLMLNNTNLPDSITKINITDLNLFNLYQFSKEENIVDNNIIFIIYPDEYANSELLTSKYKLTLNREIYKKLLESNINPYLLDLNNQSAVFPILKVHNYSIVKELKTFIDYREYSDVNALDFLIEEYNNHYTLLTNKENDFNKWLSNFVIYQKNEVKTLILSNDKFGNNVPNYLEDSFEIVLYLTSQYLSESINKMPNDLQTKIKTAFNHTIDFKKYLFINENLPDVYSSEKDNFLQDLIDNKQIEINKIIKLYEKLNDGSNKDALKNRKLKIESEIANYDSLMDKNKISKKSVDNSKILDRYNSLKYNEGTMTKALSKLIKSDKLNESLDLLIFNFYKKESELINTIKTTKSLDSMYIDCYENINNLCEIYFTFGNYSENNKVLKFSLELLQFMTKHFIIFPYIIILKKTLYAYFQSIYPNFDIDDISNRINFCFDYDFVYGGKLKKLEEHLFTIVVDKLVTNSVRKFANNQEELEFVSENISEILDNIILLFTINPIMPIPVNSKFFVNMKEINAYFDTFIPKTILNWLVVIENTYKFNINQGRIVRCIFNLTQ